MVRLSNESFLDPGMERVDIRQIYDQFPGLHELYSRGSRNAFYLVKFWVWMRVLCQYLHAYYSKESWDTFYLVKFWLCLRVLWSLCVHSRALHVYVHVRSRVRGIAVMRSSWWHRARQLVAPLMSVPLARGSILLPFRRTDFHHMCSLVPTMGGMGICLNVLCPWR